MDQDILATIQAVLDGDSQAYAAIVSRYQDEVWRVCASILHSHADTEDLVQQTFIQAYKHLDQWDPIRDFGAWVRGIARNQARMLLRGRSREYHRLKRFRELQEARLAEDADDALEEARVAALRRCRSQLKEDADDAVRLRYEEGLDFEVIADRLGRSLAATRKLLSRVRMQLKDCVERRLVTEAGA